jgi:hypothetical protein
MGEWANGSSHSPIHPFAHSFRRALLITAGTAVLAGAAAAWLTRPGATAEPPRAPAVAAIDLPGVCPWRDPDGDLRRYFPTARDWRSERRSLAARWRLLRDRLGRAPAPEDALLDRCLLLDVRRQPAGRVLLRRVRGEDGAIELVAAVDVDGRVKGVRVQRDREAPDAAALLHADRWLARFRGLRAAEWPGEAAVLRGVPAGARASARAVAEGVRTLLILDDLAGAGPPPGEHDHAHPGSA